MKLSPKQKKWVYGVLILLFVRFAVGGILFYIIEFRFKDIVQLFIKKESNGLYAFEASRAEVSLWNKSIDFYDVKLLCNDTLQNSSYGKLLIPKISITIQSWKDLIMHEKVCVDSLVISSPTLELSQKVPEPKQEYSVRPSEILRMLQKLLIHFQVHLLKLENGAFTFNSLKSRTPFICNGINISVKNFIKDDSASHRFLSSDDIDISLQRQHWYLPDGSHKVSFAALHFSGKDQYLQLDTFSLQRIDSVNRNTISLNSDKAFLNSKQLFAIFETEELIIDSLLCFHPVLNFQTPGKGSGKSGESACDLINQLFARVNIKYIDVRDGQVIVNDQNTNFPNYEIKKTNVIIYNLSLQSKPKSNVAVDSVHLDLNKIQFVTADSMFQMTVNEFTLHKNDLLLKNVFYSPTNLNQHSRGLEFTASKLHLKNINLEDLLRKKILASEAVLYGPEIRLHGDELRPKNNDSAFSSANFYKTLHSLHDLIAVKKFKIISGNVKYSLSGTRPLNMSMTDMNADILLDHFLISDSLIGIKKAIPNLAVRKINILSPKLNLVVNNYQMDGVRRRNWADRCQITLANSTKISCEKIYWEVLDWDLFEKGRRIHTDYLKVHELLVDVHDANNIESNAGTELPVMDIGKVEIDHCYLNKSSNQKTSIRFEGQNVCTSGIHSAKKGVEWQNAEGIFTNVNICNKNVNASVNRIEFNNQFETIAKETSVTTNDNNGYLRLQIPIIKINNRIQSTDISNLHLNDIAINDAAIQIYKNNLQQNGRKNSPAPINFSADNFVIKSASLQFKAEASKDTLTAEATINLFGTALKLIKDGDKQFEFARASANISALTGSKNQFAFRIPEASIVLEKCKSLKNIENISFNSSVLVNWKGGDLKIHNPKGTSFAFEKVSGSFYDSSFFTNEKIKLRWQAILDKTKLSDGKINYYGKTSSFSADSLKWDPNSKTFSIRAFKAAPYESLKETFKKAEWQSDYITVEGDKLTISGIHFGNELNDSLITINKIWFYKSNLATTKDKQKPFKHAGEKPMLTKLISRIHYPLQIDSLVWQKGNITVSEISARTHKEGVIPFRDVNFCIRNISNRTKEKDSLIIDATGKMYNSRITNFHYEESYADSLSSFSARYSIEAMALTELSYFTNPLVGVNVDKGSSDTLFSHFYGNKYAAIGQMNFYYNDLKVRLLNPQDSTHRKLILSLENTLANTFILRKKNSGNSIMYFERDREKSVFNFSTKTTLSGIFSATGIRSSKKYLKEYAKKHEAYSLPAYKG